MRAKTLQEKIAGYPARFMEWAERAQAGHPPEPWECDNKSDAHALITRFNRFRNLLVEAENEFAFAAKDLIVRKVEVAGKWFVLFKPSGLYADEIFAVREKPSLVNAGEIRLPGFGLSNKQIASIEEDETEAKMEALIFGRKLEENTNVQETPRVEQVAPSSGKGAPQLDVEEITRVLAADEVALQGEKRIEACGIAGHAWEIYGSCEKCGVSKTEWERGSWRAK